MSGVDEHLRSLVAKIETLKPHFGRAQADIEAICQRARNKDYRGVLQNTRLVVETLFRAMVSKDKSQTPGKQMLDQLLQKLSNELPTHVAVHARTIQAWGNVGAHDHATDLFAPGVEVKPEEAIAALNALVPILEWYRAEHIAAPSVGVPPAVSAAGVEKKSHAGKILAVVMVVLFIVFGSLIIIMQAERATSSISAREAIDKYYISAKEPPPPDSCKAELPAELAAIADATVWMVGGKPNAKRPEDTKAHDRLEQAKIVSGEGKMFLARARLYVGAPSAAVVDAAEAALQHCESAIALASLGSAQLFDGKIEEAKKAYTRAVELAPDYAGPKINLGLIELRSGNVAGAIALFGEVLAKEPDHPAALQARATALLASRDLEGAHADMVKVTAAEPNSGSAFMLLGMILKARSDAEGAGRAFCRAKELGEEKAAALCP